MRGFGLLTIYFYIFLSNYDVQSQAVCIKTELENDFPSGLAVLGCDVYFHSLWSNSIASTIQVFHPSVTNRVFKLSVELYPNHVRQEITPALINGQWISSASVSVSDHIIIEPVNEGKAVIAYKTLGPGCYTQNTAREFEVITSEFSLSDSHTTFVDSTSNGTLSHNDIYIPNTVYDTVANLLYSPANSTPVLTLSANGHYSFIADKKGKYTYKIRSCRSSCCAHSLHIIQVVDKFTIDHAIAHTDYTVTLKNSPILLNNLANDGCVSNNECAIDDSSLEYITDPKNGTLSKVNGTYIYTPELNFLGHDTIQYKICALGNSPSCDTALQIVWVRDSIAPNTTSATDDFISLVQDSTALGNVLDNDNDAENDNQAVSPKIEIKLGCKLNLLSDGTYTFTPLPGFNGSIEFQYQVCDDNVQNPQCANATITFLVMPSLALKLRAYLEGSLMNANGSSTDGRPLMRDNLRVSPFNGNRYIPLEDPYQTPVINGSGIIYDLSATTALINRFKEVGCGQYPIFRAITNLNIFDVTGQDAIVDWIFVELRDKNDSTFVIASRAGLLQRDGDIVDLDGISPLLFPNVAGDKYFIALKHRNHLGVMSQTSLSPDLYTILADFTSPTFLTFDKGNINNINYAGTALKSGVKLGYMCMYAGDFDSNGIIKFESPNDDLNQLIDDVLALSGSTSYELNYDSAIGYLPSDYDMNSKSKFDNPFDDRNSLYAQVLLHPLNELLLANFKAVIEQLP